MAPGSGGKARGRKPGAGGTKARGADGTPGKVRDGAAGGAPGSAPGDGAGAGGSGAGGSGTAAAGGPLAASGGVAKKRGRPKQGKATAGAEAASAAAAAAAAAAAYESDGREEPPPDTLHSFRGTFAKELKTLMYGFGDSPNPIQETVDVVEDILVEYVRETVCAALSEAGRLGKLAERDRATGQPKLKIDEKDILFLVRKDPKKYNRIRDLLEMQQMIKEARKMVDATEIERLGTAAEAEGGADAGPGEGGEELLGEEDVDLEQLG